jgi:uncharacterized membrane protein YhaH (DUF805 family)
MNYYLHVLQNYATFKGRARRSEYWYFTLFNALITVGIGLISIYVSPYLSNIYTLATIIPSIAVGIRRMHDVDKSGWFILIPFYNLYLACTEGTKGANSYGEDPKEQNV